jgi:hypothetical protein
MQVGPRLVSRNNIACQALYLIEGCDQLGPSRIVAKNVMRASTPSSEVS